MDNCSRLSALDELHNGLRALQALRELLCEATGCEKDDYDVVSPDSLLELISMVDDRLQKAGEGVDICLSI